MKEIEVKFKLSAGTTFGSVVAAINKIYPFSGDTKTQNDTIFVFADQLGGPLASGSKIVRIRQVTADGKPPVYMLTLKITTNISMVSDEYEFEVNDQNQAEAFLLGLGLVESVRVNKKRLEFKAGGYTICIDEVDKLGVFIELETLTADENADITAIQNEMKTFLQNLGLSGEINQTPYDAQVKALKS